MTYGAGSIWAFRTDIANATPMKIADLEEGSVQWSGKLVKKYGQSRVPIAIARGEEEIKGKLKFASQQARILSDLFHGVPLKSGMLNTSNAEPATAAASVVVQHASSFLFDNGVMNVNNAVPFQRVNSNPAVGQYSLNVATGTYTFSGADATALVPILISYGYTDTTVAGQTLSVVNAQQGTQPAFQITMEDVFNGPTGLQKKTLVLNYAIGTSYNESGKNGDFKSPELDFEAGDPGTGIIATYSYNGLS
jgi:hypothetical protein